MLISAIRSNLGVALLPRFAIQKDLENGDLVIPCDLPMSTGNRFVLTYKEDKKDHSTCGNSVTGSTRNRGKRTDSVLNKKVAQPPFYYPEYLLFICRDPVADILCALCGRRVRIKYAVLPFIHFRKLFKPGGQTFR